MGWRIRGGKTKFRGLSLAGAGEHVGNCKYVLLVMGWPDVPRWEMAKPCVIVPR